MKYRVSISPEVAAQILSTSSYYEGVREGFGVQFEAELQEMLDSIGQSPFMYPQEFGPVRRALMKRFSQILFYTVDADTIIIRELRNAHRKPPNWRARGFRDN